MTMSIRNLAVLALALALALALTLALAGCSERDTAGLQPAEADTDPLVFDDDFAGAVDFQAFLGSQVDAVSIDTGQAYLGTASLKVTVPGPGALEGTFAGGAFTTYNARDLSGYDALSFYAKSSVNSTLNVVGLGNDNTGTSLYEASRTAVPLTTEWTRVLIPIPDARRLTLERGLFFFAEGYENDAGFELWFDEVRFVELVGIGDVRPAMDDQEIASFVGAQVNVVNTRTTFDVDGTDVLVGHMPGYFDFTSSADSVATLLGGRIVAVGGGTATISARLDTVPVVGTVTLNVSAPPTAPAAAPAVPAADVICLFSDAYDDVAVDTWHAPWQYSTGEVLDFAIAGDAVKVYMDLNFAGIEFTSAVIDASAMTHLHLDVWAPAGTQFKVKLIDFGADGIWGQAPDSEWELEFNASSTPAFGPGVWNALEIPLADFQLVSRAHLAQMVISSGDVSTVYMDNVFFHK